MASAELMSIGGGNSSLLILPMGFLKFEHPLVKQVNVLKDPRFFFQSSKYSRGTRHFGHLLRILGPPIKKHMKATPFP
jgi:hypothetical protein